MYMYIYTNSKPITRNQYNKPSNSHSKSSAHSSKPDSHSIFFELRATALHYIYTQTTDYILSSSNPASALASCTFNCINGSEKQLTIQSWSTPRLPDNLYPKPQLLHLHHIYQPSAIKYPLRAFHLKRNPCPLYILARNNLLPLASLTLSASLRTRRLGQISIPRVVLARSLKLTVAGGHLADIFPLGGHHI